MGIGFLNFKEKEKQIPEEFRKIAKKIIIDQEPNAPIFPNDIAQGNKNAISKSKIINKIATK